MKTLYLHIGTPKTATSSLQKFCFLNQEALHDYNFSYRRLPFSYPNVGQNRNAHFLIGPGAHEKLTAEKKQEYQDRLDAGLQFIHEQFSEYDNVILTEEHLWYALNYVKWDPVQIILDDASAHGYTVKVLVYLRRQDGFLISNWNQLVKKQHNQRTIEEQLQIVLTKDPLIAHYDQALDKLSEKIGAENIIVRRFEASSWPDGIIYRDFLAALGLSEDLPLRYPAEEVNQSLKYNYIEIKRKINTNLFLTDAQKDRFCLLVKKASDSRPEHEEYGILSTKEVKKLLALFKKGNARTAKEYIRDGRPLFTDEIKKVKKWRSDNEYMLEDEQYFLSILSEEERLLYYSAAILDLQQKYDMLTQQVQTQEESLQNQQTAALQPERRTLKNFFRSGN